MFSVRESKEGMEIADEIYIKIIRTFLKDLEEVEFKPRKEDGKRVRDTREFHGIVS